MKIADHLSKEQKQQLNKAKSPKKKRNKENINWHEIMDQDKRGLHRGKGGAWK